MKGRYLPPFIVMIDGSFYIVCNPNSFRNWLCLLVASVALALMSLSFWFTSARSICTSSIEVLTYLEIFRL